ncbi:hypothetical protein R5R35_011343 [Gryllus longicercus]|uniref:PUL domain-containing protein n=1 Tax=Gryllus longicercus TaxID=2509291 RepID=A0AAN9W5C7_9ORTH
MAAESAHDGLPKLIESLSSAIEKNTEDVSKLLDSIAMNIQEEKNEWTVNTVLLDHLQNIMSGESDVNITKSAKVISELAKTCSGREMCVHSKLLTLLMKLLRSRNDNISLLIQVCRALGNICYENDIGRQLILDADCLPLLLHLLEKSLTISSEEGRNLRSVSAGFLLNLLSGNDEAQEKAVDLGVVSLLCKILEIDGSASSGEEACTHVLLILGLLADPVCRRCPARDLADALLDEHLYKVAVQVLGASQSPDVSEMCLELLHSQAENEQVKVYLANAGLCELLIKLLEKHKPQVEDDEARNLMKMACDLIALVLTGDESMNILYSEGHGEVFHAMVSWLGSDDEDLQITGVLAMGNFARTDKHCIQMVEAGVSKKLLALVEKNNSPDGDIRLQHALLSAIRNLVIPGQNKSIVLKDGLVKAVTPMLAIPTFPVVFKLLGTLRMVVDGQEDAACELGKQRDLVDRLVKWCDTDDHPGVQGEANRLLAWLIKNSRNAEVLSAMIEAKALPCLVKMVSVEHAVMQIEALIALVLTVVMRPDSVNSLLEANIGESLYKLLKEHGASLSKEVLLNLLCLIEELVKVDNMKKHLLEKEVVSVLKPLLTRQSLVESSDKINRLIATLDAG